MPSPVGHALGGMAAGWAVRGRPRDRSAIRKDVFLFGALGMLADIDLLVGTHSGPTHGLGAALIVGAVAWALATAAHGRRSAWFAVACACAYASHTLLDWLGTDTTPPIGIMALWPFRREYYQAPFTVFRAVSRRISQPDLFWIPNLVTLLRELLILVPVLSIIAAGRRRP